MTRHDERGAALILAIAFMVVIGMITSAMLSSLTSAVSDRGVLDTVRNRQYAADAAVETSIARVRDLPAPGPGRQPCGPPDTSALNDTPIRVDCTDARTVTIDGFEQRNVIFTSCVDTSVACTDATTIVRAQVNYEVLDPANPVVTKTYVQSWTVNR